jgi:uncharacterized membrane protein YphA (DoxX/SURF4 family)
MKTASSYVAGGTGVRGQHMDLGYRVFALGVMLLGVVCLAARDFVLSLGLPDRFPYPAALAYGGGAFMVGAGAAMAWRRTTAYAAASLTAFYTLIIIILIDGPYVFVHPIEYGTYSTAAEQVAIAAAGLIVYANSANIGAARTARLIRFGQLAFGVCPVLFGPAHFFYMNLTVPLVPKFLPPSQEFWAYATGIAHIAGGIAILTGVQARLAAILLTIMYASFTPLVHLPTLVADPSNHFFWSENALNLALTGAAWVVADSFRRRRVAA